MEIYFTIFATFQCGLHKFRLFSNVAFGHKIWNLTICQSFFLYNIFRVFKWSIFPVFLAEERLFLAFDGNFFIEFFVAGDAISDMSEWADLYNTNSQGFIIAHIPICSNIATILGSKVYWDFMPVIDIVFSWSPNPRHNQFQGHVIVFAAVSMFLFKASLFFDSPQNITFYKSIKNVEKLSNLGTFEHQLVNMSTSITEDSSSRYFKQNPQNC